MLKGLWITLAATCALSFVGASQAQNSLPSNATVCDAFRILAGSIMQSRQNGESKASLLAIKSGNPDHDKLGAMLINEAYNQPVVESADGQGAAIMAFADKWRATCLKPVSS